MDYFSKYSKCNSYYTIYNKNLKCAEYLRYAVNEYWKLFTLDGMFHNIKGPAHIQYDKGQKYRVEYWVNDKRHNTKGPAFAEYYYDNGKQYHEEYWVNNIKA